MAVSWRSQLCLPKMNIEVHWAHHLWYILVRNPLHPPPPHSPPPPLQYDSTRIGVSKSWSALFNSRRRFSIYIGAAIFHSMVNSSSVSAPPLRYPLRIPLCVDWYSLIWFRTRNHTFHCSTVCDRSSSIHTASYIMQSPLLTYCFPALCCCNSTYHSQSVLLCLDRCPSIALLTPSPHPFGAPQLRFDAHLFHSALLQNLLCTPLFHTALPIWRSCHRWFCFPSEFILLHFISPICFTASEHLITALLDITNRAKQHLDTISSTG